MESRIEGGRRELNGIGGGGLEAWNKLGAPRDTRKGPIGGLEKKRKEKSGDALKS
ncbi:hypothetical protein CDAR_125241, partial [Caerostris darwini]